jgi:hypothetical protein
MSTKTTKCSVDILRSYMSVVLDLRLDNLFVQLSPLEKEFRCICIKKGFSECFLIMLFAFAGKCSIKVNAIRHPTETHSNRAFSALLGIGICIGESSEKIDIFYYQSSPTSRQNVGPFIGTITLD